MYYKFRFSLNLVQASFLTLHSWGQYCQIKQKVSVLFNLSYSSIIKNPVIFIVDGLKITWFMILCCTSLHHISLIGRRILLQEYRNCFKRILQKAPQKYFWTFYTEPSYLQSHQWQRLLKANLPYSTFLLKEFQTTSHTQKPETAFICELILTPLMLEATFWINLNIRFKCIYSML